MRLSAWISDARWFFAALPLNACSPDESKAGTLGNGSFSYDCIDAQDPNCPNASVLDQQPFPSAIAFGGRFDLTYTPKDPTTYPNVSVAPVSSDFFLSQGNAFAALRVGTPWFVAFSQDGLVLDITPVAILPIASVRVADITPAVTTTSLVGSTHTFGAVAEGALGEPLAGTVLYSWASSDPTVAAIQDPSAGGSPSSTVTVVFAGTGKATLTAWTSTAEGSTIITVEALP